MDRNKLKALLIRHEGLSLKLYKDSRGLLTIGYGRCIELVGISEGEANYLLENSMGAVVCFCRDKFPWFNSLNDDRQNVLCSMAYNMGSEKLLEFKKMLAAIAAKDFEQAATEMLCSVWASQVGSRATELADMMRTEDIIH